MALSESPAPTPGSSLTFNLVAIAALIGLAAIALAYAIDGASRSDGYRIDEGATLVRTIAGKDLEIPESWFRYAEQKTEGFARQIDLQFNLPLGAGGTSAGIEVTLLPNSRVRPSASLLDNVYLHQFASGELSGPPGLIGKRLDSADGYAEETVWFDPISADPFVAKCAAPVAIDTPTRCLRSVRLGPGLAAVYVFDAEVLENWRDFDRQAQVNLARIGL
jgi:hypothetical protein